MKINIPNIDEQGFQSSTDPYYTREANEDYFNTIDDAKKYIFENYCDETYEKLNIRTDKYNLKTYTPTQMVSQINKAIDHIDQCILNNKSLTSLKDDFKSYTNYKLILKNMTEHMKSKYELELAKLKVIHKSNLIQKNKFIKDNKNELIEYLNLIKQDYIDKIKNKQKEYLKNWNQKRNELLGIKPRVKLTEEQKLENIKPKVKLTEEQKLENLKESQKKYYKKKCNEKELLEHKVQEIFKIEGLEPISEKKILTEKELKRKECNKKYYDKKKIKQQESNKST